MGIGKLKPFLSNQKSSYSSSSGDFSLNTSNSSYSSAEGSQRMNPKAKRLPPPPMEQPEPNHIPKPLSMPIASPANPQHATHPHNPPQKRPPPPSQGPNQHSLPQNTAPNMLHPVPQNTAPGMPHPQQNQQYHHFQHPTPQSRAQPNLIPAQPMNPGQYSHSMIPGQYPNSMIPGQYPPSMNPGQYSMNPGQYPPNMHYQQAQQYPHGYPVPGQPFVQQQPGPNRMAPRSDSESESETDSETDSESGSESGSESESDSDNSYDSSVNSSLNVQQNVQRQPPVQFQQHDQLQYQHEQRQHHFQEQQQREMEQERERLIEQEKLRQEENRRKEALLEEHRKETLLKQQKEEALLQKQEEQELIQQREQELQRQKEQELKKQREQEQREQELQRQKEQELQRQKEQELLQQKEQELQRQRDQELQQKEQELQRQREQQILQKEQDWLRNQRQDETMQASRGISNNHHAHPPVATLEAVTKESLASEVTPYLPSHNPSSSEITSLYDSQTSLDETSHKMTRSTRPVEYGLLQLAIEDENQRQISDYSKYIFDEEDDDDDEANLTQYSNPPNVNNTQNNDVDDSIINGSSLGDSQSVSVNNILSDVSSTPQTSNESLPAVEPAVKANHQGLPVTALSSTESSLKEAPKSNFNYPKVRNSSSRASRTVSPSASSFEVNRYASPHYVPSNLNPDYPSTMDPSIYHHPAMMGLMPDFHSPNMYPGARTPSHGKSQSIATADLKRRSMMAAAAGQQEQMYPPYMPQAGGNRMSLPPNMGYMGFVPPGNVPGYHMVQRPIIKTSDASINRKIEEFIELRSIIASGNKSLEYRLKWVKMLISATNYKLYAYINVKGEPVLIDQAAVNKPAFVKSSVTHLLKMVKDYENNIKKNPPEINAEICYIYGCLLKHEYMITFNQDFGVEKDIPLAIEYLEKSIELNPSYSKSHYRLADIYEYELPERFEESLPLYKTLAKLGYNRAIYKIALLYLNVAQLRSIKFLGYFTKLSNIDLDSKDVQLYGDDRDELEEVVGLATYELGKIYEGIYPGDLTPESEFVEACLEKAPVNYAKSLTYYNKAAKLNCLLAWVKLGSVYEYGELNRQHNPSKSIQWYIKASTSPLPFKRHPDALLGLCRWCLQGSDGLSKHIPGPQPDKAVMWCEKAVKDFETAEAYYALAELTHQGLAKGNYRALYKKAHELGHPEAGAKIGLN